MVIKGWGNTVHCFHLGQFSSSELLLLHNLKELKNPKSLTFYSHFIDGETEAEGKEWERTAALQGSKAQSSGRWTSVPRAPHARRAPGLWSWSLPWDGRRSERLPHLWPGSRVSRAWYQGTKLGLGPSCVPLLVSWLTVSWGVSPHSL